MASREVYDLSSLPPLPPKKLRLLYVVAGANYPGLLVEQKPGGFFANGCPLALEREVPQWYGITILNEYEVEL